ncbi:ATP-grasp domain-containing protein [Streptomonospora sp. PA3]|uniref:ATP-grasp domain-containing protein n=1 Tax=Streptomonospora sp. PA3 TaxID=2607326 RepID=UPI0012DECE0C|nr:ATP-grasp domain-containing protein [Streptomonospora sp. PA3]MUL40712.1 ATP-grasp domain-containing protein [Streptomonospora sp. PA3]
MSENVFVLGMDEHNRAALAEIPGVVFHPLLTIDRVHSYVHENDDLSALLDEARAELDAFDGPVHGILGYWDFPVSTVVPILCAERGLPAPSLESVVKCEHKYWSRLEQAEVIDELPGFAEIPFDAERPPDHMRYPMWLKPVKGFSSELAFRVEDEEGFRDALARIRDGAGELGGPFEWVLDQVELPEAVARAGGTACLAEEEASGRQLTVEGYVYKGRPHAYGVIDSLNYPDTSSFLRYQYPSELPGHVQDRVRDVSSRVVTRMGLDDTTFNIEYFWDPDTDEIRLLEVNPRHSQSHAYLTSLVDGRPNHSYRVDLALGREPEIDQGGGEYPMAAKWFLRRFADGVVRIAPGEDDVAGMARDIPGTSAEILVEPGTRLSELPDQDSYSYAMAVIYTGAADAEGLQRSYELCLARLPFDVEDVEAASQE